MNCNEIRELISCMLDNELSAEDSAVVTEHLAECPECMRAFEAFHAISLSMEALEDVPDGFTESVMTRITAAAETPTPKKKRSGFFRIAGLAGMAACVALVMMAGTRFANTHMYVGGGNGDTAEFVHIRQTTPTPALSDDLIAYASETAGDTEAADPTDNTMAKDAGNAEPDPTTNPDTDFVAVVSLTPDTATNVPNATAPTPAVTPTPVPVVTPTPIPPMQLMFLEDLLIVDAEADFDLFTEFPAYEAIIKDEDGNTVALKIWLDGLRVYCKNEAAQTAWYTIGTPAQLTVLLGEPAVTPVPVTATPTPATPTPAAVAPTPEVNETVTPTPQSE